MTDEAWRRAARTIDYITALDELGDFLRFEALIYRGEVMSFLVQFETTINGERVPVVRYDSRHGRPHRDLLDRRGRSTKSWLPSHVTPNEALTAGYHDLIMNWERYKDEFLRSPR